MLRDEPVPTAATPTTSADALATAPRQRLPPACAGRRSGLAALCRALQGRPTRPAELLDELAESWSAVPALASGEWVGRGRVRRGPDRAGRRVRVRGMLDRVGHRTPWAEAALRTVTAAVAAAADDDQARAGAALRRGGRPVRADPRRHRPDAGAGPGGRRVQHGDERAAAEVALAEVRAFALRNGAPGLLRLAGATNDPAWSPTLAS